uniref:Uncharacterized protein n=1 Tax=Tetranychus urticae TaxID=32264 RepID=T1L5L3_TETUR
MLINELPDDCFLEIFDYIQDLKDLINCFKEMWRSNLNKIYPLSARSNFYEYASILLILIQILSKQIADLLYTRNGETPIEDIIKLIRDSESLKGIIYGYHYCMDYRLDFESIPENPNLEMLSTGYIDLNIKEINENMKQLYLWDSTLDVFKEVAHHFPNLERLKIYNGEGTLHLKKSRIFFAKTNRQLNLATNFAPTLSILLLI